MSGRLIKGEEKRREGHFAGGNRSMAILVNLRAITVCFETIVVVELIYIYFLHMP
jgi:hypothetical protein